MNTKTKVDFMDKMVTEVAAKIKNETVHDLFLAAIANSCTEKIQLAAASSTGKYHPAFAHGEGGLLRHIRCAVHFAERLSVSSCLTPMERDIAIAAAGLHDLCKSGINWDSEYTVFEHPILVRCLLDANNLSGDEAVVWSQICDAIDSHMGCWNKPTERDISNRLDEMVESFEMTGRHIPSNIKDMSIQEIQTVLAMPTPRTPVQIVVATADYMASDKQLHVQGIFDDEAPYWEVVMAKYEHEEPASEKQKNYILSLYNKVKETGSSSWDWVATSIDTFSKKKAGGIIFQLKKELEKA